MVPFRSGSPSTHILKRLLAEPEVLWAEQQVLQPYKLYSSVSFNDLRWEEQWYMNREGGPTYNVLDVWKMGFTGKGVVVAVVDEGIEKNHKELQKNFDQVASFDFIENNQDPSSSNPYDSLSHGNNCAGVIAAVANNSYCGVGIAYSANIAGIRILDKELTDALKAKGLGYRQDYVDIYSNSWGPKDNGFEVAEVGVMTEEVIRRGALEGRKGRGSIFVFAVGNGGFATDCCSFNGLVNSIYTIAITGVNEDGSVPRYGERCPGIMAVTYSREIFSLRYDDVKVITASHYGQCTGSFSASSAAAAMASGLIALALESNKQLSWRDVQHIIIRSSRADSNVLQTNDWITNGANLTASNYVGFGLMDAYKLVSYAKNWTLVPPQVNYTMWSNQTNRVIPSDEPLTINISSNIIKFLEHVQIRVTLNFTRRGDLEMNLTSPLGTTSRLIQHRPRDSLTSLNNWTILTLQHWGENPAGVWKLTQKNFGPQYKNTGVLFRWALILYGTETDPMEENSHIHAFPPKAPATEVSPNGSTTNETLKVIPDCSKTLGNYKCKHISYISQGEPYLQFDFDKLNKLTAIAKQQRRQKKWFSKVKFRAGNRWLEVPSDKIEAGGTQDGSSIVKYLFKEPFVTNALRIYRISGKRIGCSKRRIYVYGCKHSPNCILVGSQFWGLYAYNMGADNYYKVYITSLTKTNLTFCLDNPNSGKCRTYPRTNSVLIIDKDPRKDERLIERRVIASQKKDHPEWFRSGTVVSTSFSTVQIRFDDGKAAQFSIKNELNKIRLVTRPRFC